MKVKVVGSWGGKTRDHRLSTFVVDDRLALDAGSICAGLTLEEQKRIEAVAISHSHLDHIGELPFFIDNFTQMDRRLKVFGTVETLDCLRRHIFNDVVWPDFTKIPDRINPSLDLTPLEAGTAFSFQGLTIRPVATEHIPGSVGFIVTDGKSGFAYTSDTGTTERIWNEINREPLCRMVITECSFAREKEELARVSHHLSTVSLPQELRKIDPRIEIGIFHIKPGQNPTILKELKDRKIRILRDGDILSL